MHAHTHTGTCTQEHTDYTKINLQNLKLAANSDLRWMKTAAWNGKDGWSTVLGEFLFVEVTLNESSDGFCGTGRGRSFHVDGPKTEKSISSGESGARNLEAKSIRSTGRCIKLKTVTEIRWSSVCDTVIAEIHLYLVLL